MILLLSSNQIFQSILKDTTNQSICCGSNVIVDRFDRMTMNIDETQKEKTSGNSKAAAAEYRFLQIPHQLI
jgi:hypothetical protein